MRISLHLCRPLLFSALLAGVTEISAAQALPLVEVRVRTEINMIGVDKNADRKISREEATAHEQLRRQFDDLDRDSDGQLDQGEFARFELEDSRNSDTRRMRKKRPTH